MQGEHVYPVPVLERAESRRLFVARARAAQPDFEPDEHLDELCERLDDLPLALELAAARTPLLSTQQLLERLGDRLDFLRGGRDAETRQQTLRATIEWSYELLDADERKLLAALSVFRGGWTLEAAEQVAGADLELLQSLVDKSLVRRWESGRFGMLETIREFAAEQLSDEEQDALRRRLLTYLLGVFEDANLTPHTGGEPRMDLAQAERPNVDAALLWATRADPLAGLRLLELNGDVLVHERPDPRSRACRCAARRCRRGRRSCTPRAGAPVARSDLGVRRAQRPRRARSTPARSSSSSRSGTRPRRGT